eukprot:Clim_evm2s199 gene=Clim_evmTU2s199
MSRALLWFGVPFVAVAGLVKLNQDPDNVLTRFFASQIEDPEEIYRKRREHLAMIQKQKEERLAERSIVYTNRMPTSRINQREASNVNVDVLDRRRELAARE